jgi:hypothetical protein
MAGPVVLATSPFLRADPLHDRATPARLQATIVSDLAGSGHGPAAQEPADTFSPAAGRNGERAMAVRETERLADCEPHRPAKHYSVSVKAVSRRGASTQFQVFVNPVSAAREGDRAAAAPELKLLKTYADCEELARGLSLKHIRFSTKHVPANIFSASHKEIAVEKNRRAIQHFLEHVLQNDHYSRDDVVQDFFFPHHLVAAPSLEQHARKLAKMLRVRAFRYRMSAKHAGMCCCVHTNGMMHDR